MGHLVPPHFRGTTCPKHDGNPRVSFFGRTGRRLQQNWKNPFMDSTRELGARVFIAGMAFAALASFALVFPHGHSNDPLKFVCYMLAALLASPLKVSLPSGTLSVNFLFTLLGILELSLPETLLIGLVSTLGTVLLETSPAPATGPAGLQSLASHGFGGGRLRRLPVCFHPRSACARSARSGRCRRYTLRREHPRHLDHHRVDRKQAVLQGLDRLLSLVLSLLHGGGRGRGSGQLPQPEYRLAIVVAGAAADLSDVSLLSPLPGQARNRKEAR